jgi:NitT/TauT family transport system substrate-binding protein
VQHIVPLKLRRSTQAILWLAAVALALAGCSAGGQGQVHDKTKVSVQLSWVHEYSSAAFYAAEKNGHFAQQDLDVRLEEGGFGEKGYIDPIDQVLSGSVDFGMSDASSILLARAAGKPVVAVASILQRSPLAIISLAESKLQRPQDLIGHRVAVAEGGASQIYNALLVAQGIEPAKVHTVARTTYGVEPLLKHEVDAVVAWVINEGVQVREAGQKPNFMLASDYGVDTYDFLIFTTEKMIAERPDVVERFVRAVAQGEQDVISSPDQAIGFVMSYNSKLDREAQLRRLQASLPLMNPAGHRPGMMQPEIWQTTYQMLRDQGVVKQPLDLGAAYTLKFLDKVYGN